MKLEKPNDYLLTLTDSDFLNLRILIGNAGPETVWELCGELLRSESDKASFFQFVNDMYKTFKEYIDG